MQNVSLVLCNDRPTTFGAPDVLEVSGDHLNIQYSNHCRFSDRPPNQVRMLPRVVDVRPRAASPRDSQSSPFPGLAARMCGLGVADEGVGHKKKARGVGRGFVELLDALSSASECIGCLATARHVGWAEWVGRSPGAPFLCRRCRWGAECLSVRFPLLP
jgi:hypothetical protein